MADYEYTGSGTVTIGGEALSTSPSWFYTGSGVVTLGGSASPGQTLSYTGSGGITLSGTVETDITRPGNCACCETCQSLDSTFRYFVEYVTISKITPGESAMYIHLRDEVPVYYEKVRKEDYCAEDYETDGVERHPFVSGIFNLCGVTDVAVNSFRVWVQVATSYTRAEVETAVVNYIKDWYGYEDIEEMPRSGRMLAASEQRRAF